jgi:hypothetical protein
LGDYWPPCAKISISKINQVINSKIMSLRRYFSLFYYSNIHLALLAMVLSGSISAVLYADINWQVSAIVGLSTFFTYSLDNLFDWKKDQSHYQEIRKAIKNYHKVTYLLMPLSGLGVLLLVLDSPNELKIGVLLLGASAAMLTARFANYRELNNNNNQSLIQYLSNRIMISIVWTIVVVFMPVWYDRRAITMLTWHTFIFFFCLIFVYAVLWKYEKISIAQKKRLAHSRITFLIYFLPVLAAAIVVLDILLGLRTLLNLLNLLPIGVLMIFSNQILSKPNHLKQKVAGLTFLLTISIALSATLHLSIG